MVGMEKWPKHLFVRNKNREEMWKTAKKVRCALLDSSVWSTEKKYRGMVEKAFSSSFFEIEHRMKGGRNGGAVQLRSEAW